MKSVKIHACHKGEFMERTAFSQQQAMIIINQMHRDGCTDIRCDFNQLDALPKGRMIL